jgi:hypothetical protein
MLVVRGRHGRSSSLRAIHRIPQATTRGSVVGRRGLDFGTHNESLRPPPILLGEIKTGHLSNRGDYPKSPSHSDSLNR